MAMNHGFTFGKGDMVMMGQFLAELVKHGLQYEVKTLLDGGFRITLTGGY